ncbi:MAG: tetratricopeptide repeat protein [Prolixibacteraceae bacterium]|nr:tetratricopeptide repeat protein [Prolixibacteraceae bacterium]
MKQILTNKYLAILLFTWVLVSCSTEKNTFVNRNFHNLTAHYNVYFNGNEAMKGGLYKIETQMEEDYTKTLPIFKESLPKTNEMVKGDMDIAIEKGIKLIKYHSITSPPKSNKNKNVRKRKPVKPEYNKWVDDAYMMIGKAYMYQKEYIMAASTFTQVIRRYKDEPVKYEAWLWLLRTYNESGRFAEARELIETLEGDNQFPEKLEGELAINTADFHLKENRFEEAIQYLNIGIKKIKGNKRKTRYNYILAQLYQETGNNEKALDAYQRVIRRRPEYEMLFNARINSASVFTGQSNVASLRKELTKMSKKKKNEPYLDQIYYALGNIMYNEGRIDDAIKLYRQSAAMSVSNTYQRALSCITLSDIYFDRKAYIPSGNYLDSAMVVIDDDYPNFKSIEQKHGNLSRLVTNLVAVETQDSLQHLASLSEAELNTKIEAWIAAEEKKIEQLEADMASGEFSGAYNRSMSGRMRMGQAGSGGFYFYNPSTVAYGKQEFKRLWGERKNEDDWRRKDKSISTEINMEDLAADSLGILADEVEQIADDPTSREYYIKNIPDTEEKMAQSHKIIRDALYEAGVIFKVDFNDFERSIESFNELNRRYPENTYELPSFFNLWDLYGIVSKPDSSVFYKDKILNKYPESNYAKYLINPNYFIELEAQKDSINKLYNQAFAFYKDRNFGKAHQYSKMVMQMGPDSLLLPKARFLQMVSVSRTMSQKQFADSLNNYISTYPQAEPTTLAKEILALIEEEKLNNYDELVKEGYLNDVIKNLEVIAQNQTQNGTADVSKWTAESSLLHYFVIAYPNNSEIDVNRLRFDIANYNIDHYTTLDFDIETETLNNDTKLIVVRNFDNKDAALIYFLSIIRKPEVFKTLAGHKFMNFVISNNNFREMLSDQSYEKYLQFFVKNYSIYTTGEFPEEELDTPEALMAKLNREDELVEQGEFVLIDTDDSNYVAPEPKDQIFGFNYETDHNYLIVIDEVRYRTGFIMRDLVRYNSDKFRDKRLRVVPGNLKEKTLLMVSSFENAYQAQQYLKETDSNKALFESLGEITYKTYIIGTDNFNKLRETNALDEWQQFYLQNYIRRRPTPPRNTEASVSETSGDENDAEAQTAETAEATSTSAANETIEKPDTTAVSNNTNPEQSTETVQNITENETQAESIDPETTVEDKQVTAATDTTVTEPIETTNSDINSPFAFDAGEQHNLIYLLPSSGSNKTLLLTYLNRLNATNFRSDNLSVSEIAYDEYSSFVVVSGFANKTKAEEYLSIAQKDSRVNMSLRNVNYKQYLIGNNNLKILSETKNLNDYQSFFNKYY